MPRRQSPPASGSPPHAPPAAAIRGGRGQHVSSRYDRLYRAERAAPVERRAREVARLRRTGELLVRFTTGPLETVADVGGGRGQLRAYLPPSVRRYVLLDVSAEAVRNPAPGDAPAYPVQADALHLPLADGAADAVTCLEMLYHVPRESQPGFVAEQARVLRAGGVLVLSNIPFVGVGSLASAGRLQDLACAAGLEVLHSEGQPRAALYWLDWVLPSLLGRAGRRAVESRAFDRINVALSTLLGPLGTLQVTVVARKPLETLGPALR